MAEELELKLLEMLINGGGATVIVVLLAGPTLILVAILVWMARIHLPGQQKYQRELLNSSYRHHSEDWGKLSADLRFQSRVTLALHIANTENVDLDAAMIQAQKYRPNGI